jgi:hypothetical protein
VEPGLLVLMFPIFYLTSAVSLVATAAAVWICAVEWRARRTPTELERLAAQATGGER